MTPIRLGLEPFPMAEDKYRFHEVDARGERVMYEVECTSGKCIKIIASSKDSNLVALLGATEDFIKRQSVRLISGKRFTNG
jgi:hypothetical protein